MHLFSRSLACLFFVLPVVTTAACDPATPSAPSEYSDTGKADDLDSSAEDCVIDTIEFDDAVEFANGLAAAVDPAFVHSFPHAYDQVRVPGALSTPVFQSDEFGGYVYSFHGWDVVPGVLVHELAGGNDDALFATISGTELDVPGRVFSEQRLFVARALFDALSQADEVVTEHIVPPEQVFDRSWIRQRRGTAGDRMVCDRVVFPDDASAGATYTCVISKVRWKTVQAFNTQAGGGFCPTPDAAD